MFDKLTTFQKITKLQESNAVATEDHLNDQWFIKLGTNRRSEIMAVIGNTGEPYEKIAADYIRSL